MTLSILSSYLNTFWKGGIEETGPRYCRGHGSRFERGRGPSRIGGRHGRASGLAQREPDQALGPARGCAGPAHRNAGPLSSSLLAPLSVGFSNHRGLGALAAERLTKTDNTPGSERVQISFLYRTPPATSTPAPSVAPAIRRHESAQRRQTSAQRRISESSAIRSQSSAQRSQTSEQAPQV